MDAPVGVMLFGAGLLGGVVTAIVGGASLITFPALLAAGLPAIVANASNTVALTPGNLAAGVADLERLPRWDRSFVGLMVVCVAGSVAGAVLLLVTPEKAFTAVGGGSRVGPRAPPATACGCCSSPRWRSTADIQASAELQDTSASGFETVTFTYSKLTFSTPIIDPATGKIIGTSTVCLDIAGNRVC